MKLKDRETVTAEEAHQEIELSPEGKKALKSWNRKKWLLRIGIGVLVLAVLLFCFGPYCVYRYGQYCMDNGDYAEAASVFEWLDTTAETFRVRGKPGGSYKDCDEKAAECYYNLGLESMEKESFSEAVSFFAKASGCEDREDKIRECHYRLGLSLMEQGAYGEAMNEFSLADGYENSLELFIECGNLLPVD